MNRQQRRAAAAQISPGTLTAATCERIAAAAHAGVVAVRPGLESKSCVHYARAAQSIIWAVFRDQAWGLQGGSATWATGHEDLSFGYDTDLARAEGHDGLEFHAWLAKPVGTSAIIFDASTRHIPDRARAISVPWLRGDLPYVYGDWRELGRADDRYQASARDTYEIGRSMESGELQQLCRVAVRAYSEGSA